MRREDIEIMAPVGSYESLRAAIAAGANSVYFGIGQLNMRSASAANFTADDMAEINRIAHENGVKTYLTVNTIIYDTELQQMHDVVDRAKAEGVDAAVRGPVPPRWSKGAVPPYPCPDVPPERGSVFSVPGEADPIPSGHGRPLWRTDIRPAYSA